jgi:FkbM family methyltransferase
MSRPVQLVVCGARLSMYLNPACRKMTPTIAHARLWEPIETRWILDRLRPGDVFVDVGANVGYFSLVAADAVGRLGRVFAFEPDPTNYAILQRNIALNRLQNVTAEQKAVTSWNGSASLYLCETNKGDHRIFPAGPERAVVAVETVRLDDYLAPLVDRVAVVKVDTQGAELLVVEGLGQVLEQGPALVLEYWPRGLAGGGTTGAALLDALARHGYEVREREVRRRIEACTPENGRHLNLMLERRP